MFISTSRYGLEFLKYRECAYARCVPIGKAPDSFSEQMKEYFLTIDFDKIYKSINKIFYITLSELIEIPGEYYQVMEREKNFNYLNAQLDNFLENII